MNLDSFVIGRFLTLANEGLDARTKKYLRFGFNIRALQIKESKFLLLEAIKKSGDENLSPHETIHLNIFLNSYYLNLLGALDNLAWSLQHQFSVVEGASEENKHRKKISLFGTHYLNQLRNIDNEFANSLKQHEDWFSELTEFRHPAAHRMPLYCPPGILSNQNKNEFEAMSNELKNISYDLDPKLYMDTMYKMSKTGTFEPIFTRFTEYEQDKLYPLARTIEQDYNPFWQVANIVLNFFYDKLDLSPN